ncbi:MAG: hypothetical protein DDT31_01868 [Syntrophomonadaceae bacterium]|nr:hypothetical protein [Bacillota bacterium]
MRLVPVLRQFNHSKKRALCVQRVRFLLEYGVAVEPWTDWRRTGAPALNPIAAALAPSNGGVVPSTLFYPQNELDSNPNTPSRADLNTRVFWDTRTR